jgi:hypothetical protein
MKPFLRDERMGADTLVWLASASGLDAVSGKFWLDRAVQPINFSSKTFTDDADKLALVNYLAQTLTVTAKAA